MATGVPPVAADVTTWGEMGRAAPELAEAGKRMLGRPGVTVAYLATVRRDGGPRVHPVMPVLAAGSLFVFVVNLSWKYRDLAREGRYALHSSPVEADGEELYLTGPAREVRSGETRAAVREACEQRLGGHEFEALFELGIERALHTRWEKWGTAETWPRYSKWAAEV